MSKGKTPEITFANVLLPHPLPPTMACISPKLALKFTPFRAFVTPKDFDASKSFGVTKALNGVNFKANFGEIHAIVGGNGCGKSTLAKVISGVLPLDKGKVSIMGHSPNSPIEASIGELGE